MVVSQAARRVRRSAQAGQYEPKWWSAVRTTVQSLEEATGMDLDGDGSVGHPSRQAQAKLGRSMSMTQKMEAATGMDLDGDGVVGHQPAQAKLGRWTKSMTRRRSDEKAGLDLDRHGLTDADPGIVNEGNDAIGSEDVRIARELLGIARNRRRGSAGSRESHSPPRSGRKRRGSAGSHESSKGSGLAERDDAMKTDTGKRLITITDLRAAMKRENPSVTEAQVKRRWTEMDINGDGDVSMAELEHYAEGGGLKPMLNGGVFGQGAAIQEATGLKIPQEVAEDEVIEKEGLLQKRIVGAEIRWDDRYVTLTEKRMHIRNSKDGPIREEIDLLDITHVKAKLDDEQAESGRELTRAATRAHSLHKERAEDNAALPIDWFPGKQKASQSLAQTQWEHAFEVYVECFGRTYYWRAADETECQEWVEAFNQAMKGAQESSLNVTEKIRQDVSQE